jgi:signal peptidase
MMASRHQRANGAANETRGVLYYLGVGLSGGLLALVVLLGVLAIVVPALAGATPMTVLTGSMEPNLPPGTLVIIKPTPTQDIRMGDVITYRITPTEPGVVTHRVTAITSSATGGQTFTTKGDNNTVADANPVESTQVVGKLWYSIPWIGYVNNVVGSNRAWVVPVIVGALLLYAGYLGTSGIATLAKKRRRVTDLQDPSVAE